MRITNIQKKQLIDAIWATELLCPSLFHCHAPDHHLFTIDYRYAPSHRCTVTKVADDGYALERFADAMVYANDGRVSTWKETIEAFQSWMHEVNGAVYAAAVQAENEKSQPI